MANSRNANSSVSVNYLINDAVGTTGGTVVPVVGHEADGRRSVRAPAGRAPPTPHRSTANRDPVGRPGLAERAQLAPRLARTKLVELFTQLIKGDDIALRQLGQSKLEGGHRIRIREDLSGLLKRLVLVYGNKRCRGPAVSSYEQMVSPVRHIAQHLAEMGTELTRWNCSGRHRQKCTQLRTRCPESGRDPEPLLHLLVEGGEGGHRAHEDG